MSMNKTLDILDLFNEKNRRMTVNEIAKAIDLPRSSVYRYVKLLRERSLLREVDNGQYSLGYKFIKYYRIVKMDTNLSVIAEKYMTQLTEEFNETTMLLVYSNLQTVCLATVNPPRKIKVASEPGEIVPLYAGGSSKALLAYLDDEIVESLYENTETIKYTEKTIVDLEQMKEHIREIRDQGYAYSTGELYEGVIGCGVPIFNSDNKVIASLSISGPKERMEKLDKDYLVSRLIEVANKIQSFH